MKSRNVLYQAMLTRDYRFDGKFFIGVKTTGIYCRPICPAKPKLENVEFFPTAMAAEKAGYRPCLRCHPESAPLSASWLGKSSTVQQALKMLSSKIQLQQSEEEFAAQLGVTSRHLRRLFKKEIGQTIKQIADNNRLNFAKKLILETSLSITTIAMTSGFRSLRRFNDAFNKRFHKAPSLIRKNRVQTTHNSIKLTLSYRPPFDWQTLLKFYQSHQVVGVDRVVNNVYERIFKIEGVVGLVKIACCPHQPNLILQVYVDDPKILFTIAQKARHMFDLDSDPLLIANAFQGTHPFLNKLWKKYPGLRIPQSWDPFETTICAVLGQFVSIKAARRFIEQLVKNYGERVTHPLTNEDAFIFPSAEVLAISNLEEVKTTNARKRTIKEIARLVVDQKINFNIAQETSKSRDQLLAISGIGPWSAEYISLRALANTDAFPATDLILKRALNQHPDLDLEKLRPWRSYAAIYLWKEYHEKLSLSR